MWGEDEMSSQTYRRTGSHIAAKQSRARRASAIPRSGSIAKQAWAEAKLDQVPLLAAGVAFFGFLALFPALIAGVLAYSLIADPNTLRERAQDIADVMPSGARDLVLQQVNSLASTPHQSLSIGLAIAILLALWSAAGGVGNLITVIGIAYNQDEERGFVKSKALALVMTLATIAFMLLALALVAAMPAMFNAVSLPMWLRILLDIARWVVLAVLMVLAVSVIYRVAPYRVARQSGRLSAGAVVAVVLWLVLSVGFSIYVQNFGSYAKTYGSLAAVVVLMLWLWLSAYAILFGAEINSVRRQRRVPTSAADGSAQGQAATQ